MNQARLSSGSPGLDEMLHGGYLPGSAVLLRGAPGSGKTTLALQFLRAGAAAGEAGLFVSFEEFPDSLYRDAASLGWDLRPLEASGLLSLQFTSPEVLLAGLRATDSPLLQTMRAKNIRRFALDPASHLARLAGDQHELRQLYVTLVNALKREDLTSLLLAEDVRTGAPAGPRVGGGRLGFVVDAILLLRYLEIDSAVQRAIVVLKLRGSPHSKEIRACSIEPERGLVVGKPFVGRHGLLRPGLISPVR